MNAALVGRGIGAVGVVAGIVAIWLHLLSGSSQSYGDDGTITAYVLVTLLLTAICLAVGIRTERRLDTAASVAGGAAFGFLLFLPAGVVGDHADLLGPGAWLGICSGLAPIGATFAAVAEQGWRASERQPNPAEGLPALAGAVVAFASIWLSPLDVAGSYWDAGGHVVGFVMIGLCVACTVRIVSIVTWPTPLAADVGLALAATAFGFYEALVVESAFGDFGHLATGAWLGSIGALVLLLGAMSLRGAARRGARTSHDVTAAAATPPVG